MNIQDMSYSLKTSIKTLRMSSVVGAYRQPIETNTNTNKIYIAPGILKRIRVQTHGVTRR